MDLSYLNRALGLVGGGYALSTLDSEEIRFLKGYPGPDCLSRVAFLDGEFPYDYRGSYFLISDGDKNLPDLFAWGDSLMESSGPVNEVSSSHSCDFCEGKGCEFCDGQGYFSFFVYYRTYDFSDSQEYVITPYLSSNEPVRLQLDLEQITSNHALGFDLPASPDMGIKNDAQYAKELQDWNRQVVDLLRLNPPRGLKTVEIDNELRWELDLETND